jgi:IS5 family transposase
VGGVTGVGGTALSEGRERAASGRTEHHVAGVLSAAVVQPERSGGEDALYESPVLRHFVGIDLGRAPVPDESTILQFRHLLEKHELGEAMLKAVNQYLEGRGIRITTGTIVDATIIHAPSSTKNRSGERDPEIHQTRKGKQWYFG